VRLGHFRDSPQLNMGSDSEVFTNLKERSAAYLAKWYSSVKGKTD